VALAARSTCRAIPASVREAIPWMKTGPITRFAAARPTSGQRGPRHSCTIVTSVSLPTFSMRQTTSILVVMPRMWR
jgi:hypothetical protein